MENNNIESIDLNNLGQDLESIKLSYVDDNNQIIEPEEANTIPQVTYNENVTPIEFAEDIKDNTENDNKIIPQFIFDENENKEEFPKYDNIPIVDTVNEFKDTSSPISKVVFNEKGEADTIIYANDKKEDLESNKSGISKIVYDENGNVSSVTFADDETIDLTSKANSIPSVTPDVNEFATSYVEDKKESTIENIETVPYFEDKKESTIENIDTTLVDAGVTEYVNEVPSEEQIINDQINAQRAIINEKIMDSYDVLERERKIGIADISYFKGTFDRQPVIDSVMTNFNENIDNEMDSSKIINTDSDLTHIQI